jgi:hypothetical protein
MSTPFQCEDKDTLVAFLYGEIDDEMRRQVKAHLRTCAACADEVEGLQAVRRDLLEWQPPEMALNFSVVQKPATVLRPSRWSMTALPAWAQVAAAVLVFATGAAIANVQVKYGRDGLTVTTGWMSPAGGPGFSPANVANTANQTPVSVAGANSADPRAGATPAEDWRPAFAALEQSLRAELQAMRRADSNVREASAPMPVDAAALMRRVDARIGETERRQREELAQRMTQFVRDVQIDLYRMNQGFRHLEGRTVSIEGNQRQMLDVVRRVSTQVP